MKKVLIALLIIFSILCLCCCGGLLLLSTQNQNKTTSTTCPTNYVPVCGKDNKTYKNDCEARLNETTTDYFGPCTTDTSSAPFTLPEGKVCTEIFDPVCGKDGVSYTNSCIMEIYNTTVDHQGLCTGKPIKIDVPTVETPQIKTDNIFTQIWNFFFNQK